MFSSKAFSDEPFAKVKKIQTELNGSCDYQITPEHRADTEFM
jgi:hypothetical protein